MATADATETTPLMKQYNELKAQAPDALLLFRMGDFYELFGDDAVEGARLLDLTLTSRDKGKANPMPMAGVPHHSVQSYIQRLLKAGRKVAIGEQMEDPSKVVGKSIVRRELTRVFTPGVQFDLEGAQANYLAVVVAVEAPEAPNSKGAKRPCLVACLDASTGEALLGDPVDAEGAVAEILARPIRQVLLAAGLPEAAARRLREALSPAGALLESLPSNYLSGERARELLRRHYEVAALDAFLEGEAPALALGALVTYVLRSQQKPRLSHLRLPRPLHAREAMVLGPRTAQHLDLVPEDSSSTTPNLFGFIDRTKTALGSRALKHWLLAPLREPARIRARARMVQALAADRGRRERLASELSEVYDLERLLGRVSARLANPRDTLALGRSLAALPGLAARLPESEPALAELRERLLASGAALAPTGERILKEQLPEAPLVWRDGGIFGRGVNADLDRLLTLSTDGQSWLVELEARERAASGIPSLKVRYNRVFGYYIEVTSTHLKNVPAHYQRKQTMVGAERFFTEELKKFEEEILTSSTRQKALEQELFERLVAELEQLAPRILEAASAIAELDALTALSWLANEPGWTFPEIDDSLELDIHAGRHPLVEQLAGGRFVPNDLKLDPIDGRVLTITGPNMGGKSTVMRQTALIVVLGQLGAPVPASHARWGSVSALYTRIGAHDAIARGQSTFMVEMSELAHILHHADERALLVLDEIGRGTSTYDGISVAWASLEWICREVRARTLFATHYHELTALAATLPGLTNAHMAVESRSDSRANESPRDSRTIESANAHDLRFLYELKPGAASESFGIHVARIAGLPRPIIERAWQVLEQLEHDNRQAKGGAADSAAQMELFFRASAPERAPAQASPSAPDPRTTSALALLDRLGEIDPDHVTPLEALTLLAGLKRELGPEPCGAATRSGK